MSNPFLGVFLHATGGFAAGSFYIPYKGVKRWAWESYWLVGGIFSWLFAPWVVAWLTVPDIFAVLSAAPASSLAWSYFFGLLWGIGGLTFGLSMRYLGLSLGYALALGFCAAFGTIIPPIFQGTFLSLFQNTGGLVVLLGMLVCLAGIGVCGWAGVRKERELSAEQKADTISEFNFVKGVWVAIFAGIMSACMAFAIAAGKPIADAAVAKGTGDLWQNTPVFVVVLAGGLTTNALWCVFLNWKNKTSGDYLNSGHAPLLRNYTLSAMAGVTWYLQFMFYGMGTTQMGRFDFSSWTLHMAFIIVFSNLWALAFREWRAASPATRGWISAGITILLLSTIIVGYGNKLAAVQ